VELIKEQLMLLDVATDRENGTPEVQSFSEVCAILTHCHGKLKRLD